MATEGSVNINNQNTGGTYLPVDGFLLNTGNVPVTGAIAAGQAFRQTMTLGDPSASGSIAGVNPYGGLTTFVQKRSAVLTQTVLVSGQTFTSAWFDTTLDGTTFVNITGYQTNASNTNISWPNFYVQTCDDTTNSNTVITTAQSSFNANTVTNFSGQVKQRYWRIVLINTTGLTLTSLEITYTVTNSSQAISIFDPVSGEIPGVNNYGNTDGNYPANINALNTFAILGGYNNSTSNGIDRVRTANTGHLVVTSSPLKSRFVAYATGVTGVVAETALSMGITTAGATGTAVTSYTVPTGKMLRLNTLRIQTYGATGVMTVHLRNTSVTGPVEYVFDQNFQSASANSIVEDIVLPDGCSEWAAGTVLVFSQAAASTSQKVSVMAIGYLFNNPS